MKFAVIIFPGSNCDHDAYYVLKNILRLLHPFAPFITEEIWSTLPKDEEGSLLMVSNWPDYDSNLIDERIEDELEIIMNIISSLHANKGFGPNSINTNIIHNSTNYGNININHNRIYFC